jgi:hypothetical protein
MAHCDADADKHPHLMDVDRDPDSSAESDQLEVVWNTDDGDKILVDLRKYRHLDSD